MYNFYLYLNLINIRPIHQPFLIQHELRTSKSPPKSSRANFLFVFLISVPSKIQHLLIKTDKKGSRSDQEQHNLIVNLASPPSSHNSPRFKQQNG